MDKGGIVGDFSFFCTDVQMPVYDYVCICICLYEGFINVCKGNISSPKHAHMREHVRG